MQNRARIGRGHNRAGKSLCLAFRKNWHVPQLEQIGVRLQAGQVSVDRFRRWLFEHLIIGRLQIFVTIHQVAGRILLPRLQNRLCRLLPLLLEAALHDVAFAGRLGSLEYAANRGRVGVVHAGNVRA